MFRKLSNLHANACVMVVKKDGDRVEFIGSGFIVHNKGYLMTCAHTINLSDELCVVPSGPINEYSKMTQERVNAIPVTIAQFNALNDVALLKISGSAQANIPPNLLGNADNCMVGSSVVYFGYPFGGRGLHTLKMSSSIISSKAIGLNDTKQLQLDSMVHDGNSGGTLIDVSSGQIVGIISGKFSPTGGTAAIKIGDYSIGSESSISYATVIEYGIDLMKSEGLDV